ncbi:hypothetical protein K440DRAFT_653941 [Wilcoxina mikolae CBS 423.85]|nr:hypothetical protein K440DRAFT_653941 [Wilcoxina mikolae CBS 423.85]
MKLHYQKHHQAHVTNLNAATTALITALNSGNVKIALQAAIKFHGGGHINHSLFWPWLCPASSHAASPSSSAPLLVAAIEKQFLSLDGFKTEMKKVLLGIQGSRWGWVVVDRNHGGLELVTTKDQDPVESKGRRYWNDKAAYVDQICNVVN